jgi:hypothetical protein
MKNKLAYSTLVAALSLSTVMACQAEAAGTDYSAADQADAASRIIRKASALMNSACASRLRTKRYRKTTCSQRCWA